MWWSSRRTVWRTRCRHFGFCGGCRCQDLAYQKQLYWKRLQVEECLQHLAGLRPEDIKPAAASPEQYYYRNKMEFTFAPRAWLTAAEMAAGHSPEALGGALGLHVPGSFNRVFNLTECFLQSPLTASMVSGGAPLGQEQRHSGLRHERACRFLAISGASGGQAHRAMVTAPDYHGPG